MKTHAPDGSNNGVDTTQHNGGAAGVESNVGLIICDSQLASSFREVKCVKNRLKPGHYLQKVLLGKLKSQSVPSLDNDGPADVDEKPDVVVDDEDSKEDWFKTWPDCIDKEKLRNGLKDDQDIPADKVRTEPQYQVSIIDSDESRIRRWVGKEVSSFGKKGRHGLSSFPDSFAPDFLAVCIRIDS